MDFNIIIAHRGAALGLWATIHSCEADLAGSGFKYNYRIVTNGEDPLDIDTQNVINSLEKHGKLGFTHHSKKPMSPPAARQLATQDADGKTLFFFDNHCLVCKDYFKRALIDFEHYGMDMLHSTTNYYTGDVNNYQYHLSLDKNFWTDCAVCIPESDYKPYRIAIGGHGGFAVRRDVWEEVGGYWTDLVGYGGEESYFDLKMAMLDKTNYVDPLLLHYHFAGRRGYHRHFTDDYYRNMMAVANVIGGNDWMNKVYKTFCSATKIKTDKTMFDLYMDAQSVSAKRAAEFATQRRRTLDEQLQLFRDQQIAH